MNEKKTDFLMETYKDCRSEVEMRITQRDTFAIQYIVSAGAVLSLGFLDFAQSAYLFFLLPFITLFFTIQIMYSYSIHNRLHNFIYGYLEPELAKTLGYSQNERPKLFWESFCETDSLKKTIKTPGIRQGFFVNMSYCAPFIAGILFMLVGLNKKMYPHWWICASISVAFTALSTLFISYILSRFKKKTDVKALNKLSALDYANPEIIDQSNKNASFIKIKTPPLNSKAVFIDRDGTIHIDKVQTHKIEDLEYFEDTMSSVKRLYNLGFKIVIITNQDGIRQGKYTKEDMHLFNQKIVEDFKANGIEIEAIYYSPYQKEDKHISFKPQPGMLIRACHELNIDLFNSYLIGDQVSDIIAGNKVGVTGIMVTTGLYKNNDYKNVDYLQLKPLTANHLSEAVDYIYKDLESGI